jgi:DNA-binding MarR family transcriptional regulator
MKSAAPLTTPAAADLDPSLPATPQGCTHFKLRQLLRSVSRLYDTEIAQAGLKGSQFSLLSHVLLLGPISPSELAGHLGMDASTLTRNLRPLIDKGWVLQGPGADHRGRSITITPAGQAKHAEARTHWKRAQRLLNQRLGEPEVAALHRLMAHAQAALTDPLADPQANRQAEPQTDPAEA